MLPTFLIVVAMLLEPVCVLYTRAVMESTAADLCRVLTTKTSETDGRLRSYALRRLEAVPECPPFHGGGEDDWTIETKVDDDTKAASVTISGHALLFPIYGTVARMFSLADDKGLKLSVTVTEDLRPSWLKGGYSDWVGKWKQ